MYEGKNFPQCFFSSLSPSSKYIAKALTNSNPTAQYSHHPGTLGFTYQFHRVANTLCPFTPARSSLRSQVVKFLKSNVLHMHILASLDVVGFFYVLPAVDYQEYKYLVFILNILYLMVLNALYLAVLND